MRCPPALDAPAPGMPVEEAARPLGLADALGSSDPRVVAGFCAAYLDGAEYSKADLGAIRAGLTLALAEPKNDAGFAALAEAVGLRPGVFRWRVLVAPAAEHNRPRALWYILERCFAESPAEVRDEFGKITGIALSVAKANNATEASKSAAAFFKSRCGARR